MELHEQVASKLEETKKHYNTFNNLQDRTTFLEKELSLLDTIYTKFPETRQTDAGKVKFGEEMARVKGDADKNSSSVEVKKENLRKERDGLHDQYNQLMEEQRVYYKACKDFQDECTKNEYLMSMKESQPE